MKYQVITKRIEMLDKEVIKIHKDYPSAIESALDELFNNYEYGVDDYTEEQLITEYERCVQEIRTDGYTEFFHIKIYVALFSMNQPWFRVGSKTYSSGPSQWQDTLIIQETDRMLSKVAKAISILEADPRKRNIVYNDANMWLDDTETALLQDVGQIGDIKLAVERGRLSVRLYNKDNTSDYAQYQIARL